MCEVASYLGSSSAAVTGLVDELSKRGKVERFRDPDDRRAIFVRLLPGGVAFCDGVVFGVREKLQEVGNTDFCRDDQPSTTEKHE